MLLHRRAAQPPGSDDAAQVALDERDAGALHRDVGAGAHRDADVRRASAGASLMPSPAIATRSPRSCRRLTTAAFCSGSTSASTCVDADRARDGLRGRAVVAGEHDHPEALRVQRLNRLGGRRLDRIGDADQPGGLTVDGHEHHRLAFAAERLGAFAAARAGVDAAGPRACRRLPIATRRPSTMPLHALAGDRLEVAHLCQRALRARCAPPTIAAASGCSLTFSRLAARRSSVAPRPCRRAAPPSPASACLR